MELGFLVRRGTKVCPVEVKSSKSKSIKSLVRFRQKYGKRIGTAYVLRAGEVRDEGDVVYLPYYMACML